MLVPLGPVIMALIQMPEVDIGGVAIHHKEGEREELNRAMRENRESGYKGTQGIDKDGTYRCRYSGECRSRC